jgi:hypothetical protein
MSVTDSQQKTGLLGRDAFPEIALDPFGGGFQRHERPVDFMQDLAEREADRLAAASTNPHHPGRKGAEQQQEISVFRLGFGVRRGLVHVAVALIGVSQTGPAARVRLDVVAAERGRLPQRLPRRRERIFRGGWRGQSPSTLKNEAAWDFGHI